MAENVFILGAGASATCGVPVMKDFFDEGIRLYLTELTDDKDKRILRI